MKGYSFDVEGLYLKDMKRGTGSDFRMNLSVLKKSTRPLRVGDIFAMLPPDGAFLFGRVVETKAKIGPFERCILVYIYRARSGSLDVLPQLKREELLCAPMMTNRLPWSKGYFETVVHRDLADEDRLAAHSFKDSRGLYFDEFGNQVPQGIDPTGHCGLHSYRTIDDEISKALGLPLAPERAEARDQPQ